jgi:hypothetical protein
LRNGFSKTRNIIKQLFLGDMMDGALATGARSMAKKGQLHRANWKPGQSGNPNGRTKGVPNKLTLLKQMFPDAFDDLGGLEKLVEWGRENYGDFMKLYVQLVPKERNVTIDTTLTIEDRAVRAADAFFESVVVNEPASRISSESPALPDGSVLSS